ncbi:MAG: hypothetical protein ACLGI6_13495 [Gammaproteobacteria bacterium]
MSVTMTARKLAELKALGQAFECNVTLGSRTRQVVVILNSRTPIQKKKTGAKVYRPIASPQYRTVEDAASPAYQVRPANTLGAGAQPIEQPKPQQNDSVNNVLALFGTLKGQDVFTDDAVEFQRVLREEWR